MCTPTNSAQGNTESRVPNNPGRDAPIVEHPVRAGRIVPSGKKTKASLHIGSLNLNGRGSLNGPRDQKWNAVNQLLREEKLGVLCLQETHLDETHINTIQSLYGRRIRIWNSGSESTTSSQGVAVVLNREIVDISNVVFKEIIPGRAVTLTMHWHAERSITILNVYAPNSMTDNAAFWRRLLSMAEKDRFNKPDVMTGDFNLVEEAIDRLPAKEDYAPAVDALRDLIRYFDLYNGWRLSEPNKKDYSYPQRGSVSRSRIDRICAAESLVRTSHTWDIKTTAVQTDHRLISTKLNTANTPFIGKGRWSMPTHLIEDNEFMDEMRTLGKSVMKEMRTACNNEAALHSSPIQRLHRLFKEEVRKRAREHLKKKSPRLQTELKRLRDHVQEIESRNTYQSSSELQNDSAVLHNRICDLEKKRHALSKLTTTARYVLNAERVTKYWSEVNREKKPRDIIYNLRIPETTPPQFVNRSNKMAKLARDYHERAQSVDIPGFSADLQAAEIRRILAGVRQTLDGGDLTVLQTGIYKDEVKRALKKSQSGRAPGVTDIPVTVCLTLYVCLCLLEDSYGAPVHLRVLSLYLVTAFVCNL
ncbi:Endonuclease/exonuclease/phosphatase [Fomitopsis serialis]|uniref:Endonuclease/exonuclease/phosphatase n=1 Tax=Fomitopsis serialis TaxID=139415 RepID=UPI00200821D8|nr:Endonuclease/exonuclease/phosphatase [Neoantrodia serialis]KAH9928614.1 Endonuclease/exonuclease/phosphatase [Neoantrodia serialis]